MRKWLLIILVCVGCSAPKVGRLPVHWRKPAREKMKRHIVTALVNIHHEAQAQQMNHIERIYDANGIAGVERIILKWKEQKRGKGQ